MNLRDLYTFLHKHVPKNPRHLIEQCETDVQHTRFEMLTKQRIISLYPLEKLNDLPTFFGDHDKFFTQISARPNSASDSLTPQQIQYISKIYSHFMSNLNDLAIITTKAYDIFDNGTYMFFINSTIPSFFGYFSSIEYLRIAYDFYAMIITKVPSSAVPKLIAPFFNNVCAFRYIELVANDILHFFCQDVRLIKMENMQSLLAEHAENLVSSIISHITLLPSYHLHLLDQLRKIGWENEDVFYFMFTSFIIPQIGITLRTSTFSDHIIQFKKLVDYLLTRLTKYDTEEIFNSISNSVCELPHAYDPHSPYLHIITTPMDVALVMTISDSYVELPKNIQSIDFNTFLENQDYVPLIVRAKNPIANEYLIDIRSTVFDENEYCFQKVKKPPHIPAFHKRWRFIEKLAEEKNIDPLDYFENQLESMFLYLREEKLKDEEGICTNCQILLLKNIHSELCESCSEVLANRSEISFIDYAIQFSCYDYIDKAKQFEQYIVYKKQCKDLKLWLDKINHLQEIIVLCACHKIIFEIFPSLPTTKIMLNQIKPCVILNNYGEMINTVSGQKLVYTVAAESFLKNYKEPGFVVLESKWTDLMNNYYGDLTLGTCLDWNRFPNGKKVILTHRLMQLSLAFSNITLTPFSKTYFRLIQCLNGFKNLEELVGCETKLIQYAIRVSRSEGLISTVIKIASMLIQNQGFAALCTPKETELWYHFEEIIMSFLEKSNELFTLYTSLHDKIVRVLSHEIYPLPA